MQTLLYSLLNISANVIKIDRYNFGLYHFKVGAFSDSIDGNYIQKGNALVEEAVNLLEILG